MQIFLMINTLELSEFEFNVAARKVRESRVSKRRKSYAARDSFDDYSPWADSKKSISRLDRIACLSVVILHRKYLQW